MNLNFSTATLRSLLSLTEKRDKIIRDITEIEKEIARVTSGATTGTRRKVGRPLKHRDGHVIGNGHPVKTRKRRAKRGAMKHLILDGLKAAGDAGTTVKDLAAKLGLKPQNIHVWLNTTGKKLKEIQKIGPGTYRHSNAGFSGETSTNLAPVRGKGQKKATKK